jgi:hypothetical protein
MMEFQGTFKLDGHSRFDFPVSGSLHQTPAWRGSGDATEGELVLTVARVPYFPASIESGQSGKLQIVGFEDLPITLNVVDQPRMNLRSRNLELTIRFQSAEGLKALVTEAILGILAGSERTTMSLYHQASEFSRMTG